jgi:hypothetical protein
MKRIRVTASAAISLVLAACGSSPQNINGGWNALLINPDGTTAFVRRADLAQGGGTTVNVSNFGFAGAPARFANQTGENATFASTGSSNGVQTGNFMMTISSLFPGAQNNNVVTLQGTRKSDGSISGTWTLTGLSGCNLPGGALFDEWPPTVVTKVWESKPEGA